MRLFELIVLLIPIAIGFLTELLFLPRDLRKSPGVFWLLLSLAPGMGFSFASVTYFAWCVAFSPDYAIQIYLFLEILILLVLTAVLLLRIKNSRGIRLIEFTRYKRPLSLLLIFAAAIFTIFLINFLEDWFLLSFQKPFGDWDARAIWNLRARFISSGLDWTRGFSSELAWSHPDYPLLLPLNVARNWVIIKDQSVLVPIFIGLIFQVSLLGLLVTSIKNQRGYFQALLAGVLGITVLNVSLTFRQYADIPFAYYVLAANTLMYLDEITPNGAKTLGVLTGIMVGASLWTKNEGWAFLSAVILARLILNLITRKPISHEMRWWSYFLLGLFPLLAAAIYFKVEFAPPGDLFLNLDVNSMEEKLISIQRYKTIFAYARKQFIDYGNLLVPMMPLLIIYLLFMKTKFPRQQVKSLFCLFLRITALSGSYFVVYLLTPHDLNWHISTSIDRLISQVFPSLLFLYFLVVSPPTIQKDVGKKLESNEMTSG